MKRVVSTILKTLLIATVIAVGSTVAVSAGGGQETQTLTIYAGLLEEHAALVAQ